jgi:hypothetical protein
LSTVSDGIAQLSAAGVGSGFGEGLSPEHAVRTTSPSRAQHVMNLFMATDPHESRSFVTGRLEDSDRMLTTGLTATGT